MPPPRQPFTRPTLDPHNQVNDIYDKFSQVLQINSDLTTQINAVQKTAQDALAAAASAAAAAAAIVVTGAEVPEVLTLPANATEGELVLFENNLWRYSATRNEWEQVSVVVFTGTHTDRTTNYPATLFTESVILFFETDRTVLYVLFGAEWHYVSGVYYDVLANRPTDLGTDDNNFLFHATDNGRSYQWNTAVWLNHTDLAVTLADTHANRSTYAATDYPPETLFYETDRTVLYRDVGSTWNYEAGVYFAATASRPSDLGTTDAGFLFVATDTLQTFYWTGSAWVQIMSSNWIPRLRYVITNTTVLSTDFTVVGSITGTATATLPPSVGGVTQVFAIKNVWNSSGVFTVAAAGTDTIDGVASVALSPGAGILIQSDGGGWWNIIAGYGEYTLRLAFRYVSGTVTVDVNDFSVVGLSASAITVNLPSVGSNPNRIYEMKNSPVMAGVMTVVPNGSDVIETLSSYVLNPGEGILIQSDAGNQWVVLADVGVGAGITAINSQTGPSITLSSGNGISVSTVGANDIEIAASDPAWTAYTPTVTVNTGSISFSTGPFGRCLIKGKTALVRISGVFQTNSGASQVNFSLPFTPSNTGGEQITAVRLLETTSQLLASAIVVSGSIQLTRGTTFLNLTNYTVNFQGVMEVA